MTTQEWWRHAVIYQVYLRSFQDSDGDGGGDLPGVVQKLDYIASLGVDAVWISPFFPSPMKDGGYDISDYCAIAPQFGTLSDFQQLLHQAHRCGLKILIDQVWSHTSHEHPWFQESRRRRDNPKADWYVWVDAKPDGTPPNNWLSAMGGSAWTWEPQRQQYYLHNFLAEQPDLNWYNPEVVQAILEVAQFWLELGVDGFRLDVINFLMHDRQLRDNPLRSPGMNRPDGAHPNDPLFEYINLYNLCRPETLTVLESIRQLMNRYPGTTTLAEIANAEDSLLSASEYVSGDKRLQMAYNSTLLGEKPLSYSWMRPLLERVNSLFQGSVICWTVGTHDYPRVKSRWGQFLPDEPSIQEVFARLVPALILSLPGSCCLYQGDELGLPQAEVPYEKMQDPLGIAGYPVMKGRDGSRTPIPWQAEAHQAGFTTAVEPWLPIPDDHRLLAVDQQDKQPKSLLNHYRRFLHWRKQQLALTRGNLILLETAEPVLGFIRSCAEQHLLCLFNLSATSVQFDLSLYPDCVAVEALEFTVKPDGNRLEMSAYGVFFATISKVV
jgi:alpha-glucosidase